MRRFALAGLVAAAMATGYACGPPPPFSCENDQQCTGDGSGLCTINGWCTYGDLVCPSGRRYADLAGDGLGGTCQNTLNAGTGDSSAGLSGSASDVGAATDDPATGTTASADDGGTMEPETSAGPTDDTSDEPAETAGSPTDPYGRCENGCGFEGATCLQTTDMGTNFRMCAPPCQEQGSPSPECPAALGGGVTVGCLDTGNRMNACFIECGAGGSCPNGMQCALGAVCSWE